MEINYRIFTSWAEVGNASDSQELICRETHSGKITALNYPDLRKLFVLNTKLNILKANAEILSGLEQALDTGTTAGAITV